VASTAATFVFLVTFLIAYLSEIVFCSFLVVIGPTFDLFTIPKSDLICTNSFIFYLLYGH